MYGPPVDQMRMFTSRDVSHLVVGVVYHGRLPLSVHLVIPVVGLGRVGVGDVLGLVPVLRLLVFRVVDLLPVVPVLGLLRLWVLDRKSVV